MKSRIYLSDKVPNTARRFGAAPHYYPVLILTGERREMAMFTPNEIGVAILRAKDNPEDAPQQAPSLWQRIVAWWTE